MNLWKIHITRAVCVVLLLIKQVVNSLLGARGVSLELWIHDTKHGVSSIDIGAGWTTQVSLSSAKSELVAEDGGAAQIAKVVPCQIGVFECSSLRVDVKERDGENGEEDEHFAKT